MMPTRGAFVLAVALFAGGLSCGQGDDEDAKQLPQGHMATVATGGTGGAAASGMGGTGGLTTEGVPRAELCAPRNGKAPPAGYDRHVDCPVDKTCGEACDICRGQATCTKPTAEYACSRYGLCLQVND